MIGIFISGKYPFELLEYLKQKKSYNIFNSPQIGGFVECSYIKLTMDNNACITILCYKYQPKTQNATMFQCKHHNEHAVNNITVNQCQTLKQLVDFIS